MRQWRKAAGCVLLLLGYALPAGADDALRNYLTSAQGASETQEAQAELARVSDLLDAPAGTGERLCGTSLWPALTNLSESLSPSGKRALSAAAAALLVRPVLDTFYDAPTVPIRIHYSVTGTHAVRDGLTDTLPDGRPRYVHTAAEALTRAYELLLDSLGFLPPLSDSQLGGGTSIYDVYLARTPYAGFTAAELAYGRIVGNDTILAASAYSVVHPTFSGFVIPVAPYDYLRITCAHEFFHAVHFAYDVEEKPNWQQYGFWLEGTAVWFEDYTYPDVNDWEYLPSYFNAPERSLTFSNVATGVRPYGAGSVWAFYLVERYGGPAILRDIWNRCGLKSGDNTLPAMDSVLTVRGSSLDESWHEFATWCMQTSSRWQPGTFAQGAQWPPVQPTSILFNYPAAVHFTDGTDQLETALGPEVSVGTIPSSDSAVGALGFAALAHLPFPSGRPDSSQRLYVQSLPSLPVQFSYLGYDTSVVTPILEMDTLTAGDTTLVPSWLRFDTLFVLASSGLHYEAGATPDTAPAGVTALLSAALDEAGPGQLAIQFQAPYPNPMVRPNDQSVHFVVVLPNAGDVHLDIFSLSGDRVRSLSVEDVSVWPPASLSWDGRNDRGTDVASGLYLCKLTVLLASGEREEELFRVGVVR